MNLYQKLIKVREVVPYLQKENRGSQYNYVSSSQVLSNVMDKLNELGVLLVPSVTGHKVSESAIDFYEDGKNSGNVLKRTITYFTELDLTMTWVNAENPDERISVQWYGQGVDIAGEKGVGKALTYAEKYFILKFFNIATDKDDPDSFQQKVNGDHEKPANQSKPSNQSAPVQNNPAVPVCADCHKPIAETVEQAAKVKGWCDSHKDQFQNKTLCQNCQKNYSRKAS